VEPQHHPLVAALAAGCVGSHQFKAIIHVAGINMLWRASARSVDDSTRNAVALAEKLGFGSLAFPIIGAGSGGFPAERAEAIMREALSAIQSKLRVVVVRYAKT
jgi:O-acetyl-ADP-ribose deacetylase